MIETKIAKYGNSLSVRLPMAFARELDLREGDTVVLRSVRGGIVVERPRRSRLDVWLDTVKAAEAEVGAGVAVGVEAID